MLCHLIFIFLAVNTVLGLKSDVVKVRAVLGRGARLPCGQQKLFIDGPNSYVLWLRNGRDVIYRFPSTKSEIRIGTRDYIYKTPCQSGYCHDNSTLVIKKMTDRDGGRYTCRIHYHGLPAKDYEVEVKLVASTGLPRLYSGDGEVLNKGFVGPLSLGSDLTLICEVEDRDSEMEVYWTRNGALVQRASAWYPGTIQRVDICLHNITRGELNARYECYAQNSDVSEPLLARVLIRMYLPPLSVEIRMNNNFDFEAGQPRVVDCVVVGCVPPPAIIWHLGSTMVRPFVHKELHDGNYTVSSLTLAPSLHNHRNELVCRAYNAHMPTSRFQDKVTVNVGYRPICQVGSEVRIGSVVREPETVQCIVDSSPEPLQFTWTFADSKTLYTSFTKVVGYRHRYSSTLTWLSRDEDIGTLLCRASNAFGEQKKPCIYNISLGGPPELPECNVRRIYPNSLRVQCLKGWDGGRPQMVHLDIVDEGGTRIKNVSDSAGHFYLPNIVNQVNLTAVLYATNARGKSEERIIYVHTLPAISEAGSNYIQTAWMPYIEALAGAVSLAIAATIITLATKILLARRQSGEMNPDIVPLPDGIFHREPDFIREERLLGTTNITVNQLTGCQNQYSSSPLPPCRLLLNRDPHCVPDACSSSQHSYYV